MIKKQRLPSTKLSPIGTQHKQRVTPPGCVKRATRFGVCLGALCKNLLDHLAVHVRQPEVTSLEPESQPLVVKSQQVQDRGLQVVDVNRVFADGKTEFVGLSLGDDGLDSTTCHPDGKRIDVMIASGRLAVLAHGCPAKLAAPDY
jgi:hypothetical protein